MQSTLRGFSTIKIMIGRFCLWKGDEVYFNQAPVGAKEPPSSSIASVCNQGEVDAFDALKCDVVDCCDLLLYLRLPHITVRNGVKNSKRKRNFMAKGHGKALQFSMPRSLIQLVVILGGQVHTQDDFRNK